MGCGCNFEEGGGREGGEVVRFEVRPWGWMWRVVEFRRWWVKVLGVRGRTSLQRHGKRGEWFVGVMKVKAGEWHRLGRGLYLEVGHGECEEGDIERAEDDYGRDRVADNACLRD